VCLTCAKEWIESLEKAAQYMPHDGPVNPEIRMNDVIALLERLKHCSGEPIILTPFKNKDRK